MALYSKIERPDGGLMVRTRSWVRVPPSAFMSFPISNCQSGDLQVSRVTLDNGTYGVEGSDCGAK